MYVITPFALTYRGKSLHFLVGRVTCVMCPTAADLLSYFKIRTFIFCFQKLQERKCLIYPIKVTPDHKPRGILYIQVHVLSRDCHLTYTAFICLN